MVPCSALIPLSFLLAGAAADAGAIALCWIVGTLLGALLTGHAIQFLVQALRMVADCARVPESQLQTEFKSDMETYLIALPICGLLLVRVTGKRPLRHLLRSPEFMLLLTCFVLGLRNKRFWSDWGCLGLLLLIYREVHCIMEQDRKMRVLSVCLFVGLLLCVPRRFEPAGNGSISKYVDFGAKSLAPWCPAPGGTVYSCSQDFFYTHFFRFPEAKWKYVLGYAPVHHDRREPQGPSGDTGNTRSEGSNRPVAASNAPRRHPCAQRRKVQPLVGVPFARVDQRGRLLGGGHPGPSQPSLIASG